MEVRRKTLMEQCDVLSSDMMMYARLHSNVREACVVSFSYSGVTVPSLLNVFHTSRGDGEVQKVYKTHLQFWSRMGRRHGIENSRSLDYKMPSPFIRVDKNGCLLMEGEEKNKAFFVGFHDEKCFFC